MGIHMKRYGVVRTPEMAGLRVEIVFMGQQNSDEALMGLYRKIKDLVESENDKTC